MNRQIATLAYTVCFDARGEHAGHRQLSPRALSPKGQRPGITEPAFSGAPPGG